MRRATIVAGVTAGVLGLGGAATASAADIAIEFPTATEQLGTTPKATLPAGTAFRGTIDLTSPTLAGAFPAAGILLPEAVVPNFSVPGFADFQLAINAKAGDFTGALNVVSFSYDLRGPVTYRFVATKAGTTYSCTALAASNLTLAGGPLDFATGAFSASGSVPTPAVRPDDAASTPYCLAFALNSSALPAVSTVASTYAGTVTIPGVVPLPKPAAPAPTAPKPSTPAAPTTPSTPTAPAAKPGRLAVTVSKPKTVKRGKSTVTKVVVRNTGAGTARSVTLKVAAAGKGVSPRSTSKTYATIGAGKSRTLNLRLRSTKKAAKSSAVKVTVKGAGGLSASKSTRLRLR